jgi:hypothetical protein
VKELTDRESHALQWLYMNTSPTGAHRRYAAHLDASFERAGLSKGGEEGAREAAKTLAALVKRKLAETEKNDDGRLTQWWVSDRGRIMARNLLARQ